MRGTIRQRPLVPKSVIALLVLTIGAGIVGWKSLALGGPLAGSGDENTNAAGAGIYGEYCASCHGQNLEGEENWQTPLADGGYPAPPHDETGHTWHHPDQLLFKYTKHGGTAVVGPNFKSNMPGFEDQLSDDEIRSVIDFIKSTWPEGIRQRQARLNRRADGDAK